MSTALKRERTLRLIEPIARALYGAGAERFLKLLRQADDAYIEQVWERHFRHTTAADETT